MEHIRKKIICGSEAFYLALVNDILYDSRFVQITLIALHTCTFLGAFVPFTSPIELLFHLNYFLNEELETPKQPSC